MILAIAGYFGLDIYKLDISRVTESSLGSLFDELPSKCILLLEDIDAVDMARTRHAVKENQADTNKEKKVSLSALLNALDGVASQEGRVLIMTNKPSGEARPRTRPGRVDKAIELGPATKSVAPQLFSVIYELGTPRSARNTSAGFRMTMAEKSWPPRLHPPGRRQPRG